MKLFIGEKNLQRLPASVRASISSRHRVEYGEFHPPVSLSRPPVASRYLNLWLGINIVIIFKLTHFRGIKVI